MLEVLPGVCKYLVGRQKYKTEESTSSLQTVLQLKAS
jgi:hypothetical protein